MRRTDRQERVWEWVNAAFGSDSVKQRALRMLEEAIEVYQAVDGDERMAHDLIEYIFDRPKGELAQEVGGLGITLLALCARAGLDADQEEEREFRRIMSKPARHFAARNEVKNRAGFKAED